MGLMARIPLSVVVTHFSINFVQRRYNGAKPLVDYRFRIACLPNIFTPLPVNLHAYQISIF